MPGPNRASQTTKLQIRGINYSEGRKPRTDAEAVRVDVVSVAGSTREGAHNEANADAVQEREVREHRHVAQRHRKLPGNIIRRS